MRIAVVFLVVILLVLPLTWLSLHSVDGDAERFDQALSEMDRFSALQAISHHDILSARAGMVRNYDRLVSDIGAVDASLATLGEIVAPDRESRAALADLASSVRQQEDLIERFKTNNALLQNSLAYFAAFSAQQDNTLAPLTPAIGALAATMLRLTLDTSPSTAQEVQVRLDALTQRAASPEEQKAVDLLLAHGALLHNLLPATDALLRQLDMMPERASWERLRHSVLERQSSSRATAGHYRRLLYIASLLLSALLAYLAMELWSRAQALRRRAAFEHTLAGFSLNLINADEDDIAGVIRRALQDMAKCIDADRAYLLIGGGTDMSFVWHRPEMDFASGWPVQAQPLIDQIDPPDGETLLIPQVNRLPKGPDRAALAAIGLQAWVCVFRQCPAGERSLLGFDFLTRPSRILPTGELSLLRMALDVMAGAFERRTLAEDRARLTARLERARRLETVGTLASGIAHNFNNIVGAILGYTEMASEQTAQGHRVDRFFTEIRRAGERGRELIDEILTFARHRAKPHSRIDLQALAGEAISLLRASLPREVELAVAWNDLPIVVSGAPAELQQVILNLCNNAAQAMGNAGRVDLEIGTTDLMIPGTFAQGSLSPGTYARIAVTDGGRGIDKENLERIFEPFFTTRPDGSGLGLATIKEIVHEHGGVLHVESTIDVGSRFEVWLPQLTLPALTDETSPSPLGQGEAILLVATDVQQLHLDEEVLAALGYEPVGFTSMADACAACRATPQRFDLALIDHIEPEAALLECAKALHDVSATMPILAATVSRSTLEADSLLAAGIFDLVHWPLRPAEIAAALEGSLAIKPRLPFIGRWNPVRGTRS